jgi:formylglycine-generating enzyme required for sulfatase activity
MCLAVIALLIALVLPAGAAREFRDCRDCPVMVVVPAGHFLMGASSSEPGHTPAELPAHAVAVQAPFAIGKFDVTRTEFTAFANASGYKTSSSKCDWRAPRTHGQPMNQSSSDPVVCVSWNDAAAYVQWLSRKTGKSYRLPSEAEWEYAARAGSTTSRPWGDEIARGDANYGADQCCAAKAEGKDRWPYTSPVGSFPPNAFGLYDMLGNVWQWVQDCSHADYAGAPGTEGVWAGGDCSGHMVRGGAWFQAPDTVRSAARAADRSDFVIGDIGFRVGRPL